MRSHPTLLVIALALGAILSVPAAGHARPASFGQRLVQALADGRSANVVVVGDSTSDEEDEWVFQLALALERVHPDYTFKYALWDRKRRAWPAEPQALQWGDPGKTLTIWNMSVSGSRESYARNYVEDVIAPIHADLLLVSYGQNEGQETDRFRWGIESLVETMRLLSPDTQIALVAQNPTLGNPAQDARAGQLSMLADQQHTGFVNVWGAFRQTGDPAALMRDSTHPNGGGTSLWVATVLSQLSGGDQPSPAADGTVGLIRNGDFSVFSRGVPSGWTLTNGKLAKDYRHVQSDRPWALQLTQTGAGPSVFTYRLNANWVRGKWVTFAVRLLVPDQPGDSTSVGRIGIVDDRTSADASVQLANGPRGHYYWDIVTRIVDPRASRASLVVYVNQQPGHATATIDRVIGVIGARAPLADDPGATERPPPHWPGTD